MNWSGQKEFTESSATPYLVDSEEVGTLKSHGPLAFLKVCV
jgi:serine carboxypeptidase-like clade 4